MEYRAHMQRPGVPGNPPTLYPASGLRLLSMSFQVFGDIGKRLLKNHDHDCICGSNVHPVRDPRELRCQNGANKTKIRAYSIWRMRRTVL